MAVLKYREGDPFVFISYKSDDRATVAKDVCELQNRGVNIWFDEDLTPGNDWFEEEVVPKLMSSSLVLFYVSELSLRSPQIRKELELAKKIDVTIVPINLLPFCENGKVQTLKDYFQANRTRFGKDSNTVFKIWDIIGNDNTMIQYTTDSDYYDGFLFGKAIKRLAPETISAVSPPEVANKAAQKAADQHEAEIPDYAPNADTAERFDFARQQLLRRLAQILCLAAIERTIEPVRSIEPERTAEPERSIETAYGYEITLRMTIKLGVYNNLPIEWRVMAKENGRILLLAKNTLMKAKFHTKDHGLWDDSSIRSYLNGEFMEACFLPEEKRCIQESRIENPDVEYTTITGHRIVIAGCGDTFDSIFLLSIPEVMKYHYTETYPISEGEYAKAALKGAKKKTSDYPLNVTVSPSLAARNRWWLRTPGAQPPHTSYVDYNGYLCCWGTFKTFREGIRPALWADEALMMTLLKGNQ